MNKNLQSTTKLTEFAPLQPEEKQQGVGQFISKLFGLNKTPPAEEQKPIENTTDDLSEDSLPIWAANTTESSQSAKVLDDYNVDEGRSLPNVIKRISNLLAVKSTSLQDYADTELKQYWMPDSVSKECYECSEKFTTFRRRHHCRVCGQIFCSQCCNEQMPGRIFGCTGDLRVCSYCCKVILNYLQSSDLEADLTADLQSLQENVASKYGASSSYFPQKIIPPNALSPNDADSGLRRKVSVGYQEEKFVSERGADDSYLSQEEKCRVLQNSASLRNLYDEIGRSSTGVPLKTLKYRLRTYTDCLLGSDVIDWLIYQQKASTRVQALALCQALLEAGYLENLSDPCHFIDGYALYKLVPVASPEQVKTFTLPNQDEPIWVQQIAQESSATDSESDQLSVGSNRIMGKSTSYTLDLNIEANTVYLSRPSVSYYPASSSDNETDGELESHKSICKELPVVQTSEQREDVPKSGWHDASLLREENGEKMAYEMLTESFRQHQRGLLKQLLLANGLCLSWSDVIISLVREIVNTIRPDKYHDAVELNINHYVQFKKVPGGSQTDSRLIGGIVCSKNVAHKGMQIDMENPKILLLHCSIVYQRTEGRLMSLDPVLMQEHEYLRHVVARIAALQPDIVMVHRNVSRLAQDMLREHGIVLVHNVKETVLERLSRCLPADLVANVDAHIGRPRLGTCKRFYLRSFGSNGGTFKSLMFFEGLPVPHLGDTVLLRGGPKAELVQLKKVAQFLLFATYNWRLEKSFLMDEYALPPNSKDEFFDDSKESSPTLPSEHAKYLMKEDIAKKELFPETAEEVSPKDVSKKVVTQVTSEPVSNFSDPLHTYDVETANFGKEKMSVAELPFSNHFRKALDGTILCVSPYILFPIPYLETEQGKKCKLRSFFPDEIHYSKQFIVQKKVKCPKETEVSVPENKQDNKELKVPHPFITAKFTTPCDSIEIQTLLADFRARGGRFPKTLNLVKPPEPETIKVSSDNDRKDVLDPVNHQKLAVLFCSFSHSSNNAPAFCVSPWVVHMEFYGCNDIPLGCFLERYCFRLTYACPSKTCDTPMLHHLRRFVHLQGCVSVSLKYFESCLSDESIMMWSWCTKCESVSPTVPMSADTWSYSFAKYLELMFLGNVYSRRGKVACTHSLHHDLYQYFGYHNYVATFKYTPIQLWEISLPPPIIEIKYDCNKLHADLINEIKMLALKGHDIYSTVFERLYYLPSELEGVANLKQLLTREQAVFKQKIEEVQLRLTSPTVEKRNFEDGVEVSFAAIWQIEDAVVRIKRLIVEAVEQWNLRISETIRRQTGKKDKEKSAQSELEASQVAEIVSDADSSNTSQSGDGEVVGGSMKKIRSLDHADSQNEILTPTSSPKGHHRSQSETNTGTHVEESADNRKDPDKKTVKNILSQLLPSSTVFSSISPPYSCQEHYTLASGIYANTIVFETELSSIISYTLNSNDYKKAFDELTSRKILLSEFTASPMNKQKSPLDRVDVNGDFTNSLEKSTGLLSFLRNKDKDSKNEPGSPVTQLSTSDSSIVEQLATPTEKTEDGKKAKTAHVEVQFQDANCNFFCRVYYAERFSWLRSKALPAGEEAYVRSLARSVQWNARGGKSGSNFSKTADDRFILKEMSKTEVQLFIEWAPNYFAYMQRCITTAQPTLLGKILGIYQIIFKNHTTNATSRANLLVMENLFYNRTVTQKFDLKGSVRNRLVNTNTQNGEIVLLDENLLNMTCDSPLYILPHSKAVLMAAISNDTEFLSSQSVMDYSLLVGLDEENKELVLGIIDYIRTFTWDKKLETMVKKSGILGGQGKLPTIVSPEEYQKRFIEAMHRYFLEVPDHWAGLGKGVEC